MMATMDLGAQGVDEEISDLEADVKGRIWEDPLAADLEWSLFLSAVNSYRNDSVLRPFPPMFIHSNEEKDLKSLQELVREVPAMSKLARHIHELPNKLTVLLKWVLFSRSFSLTNVTMAKFEEIKRLTGHTVKVPEPNFIFEVTPSMQADEKFERLQGDRKLMYAYHGSRTENFFSILNNGLASHMNKTSVFGEGTYLSSELSVSLIYSPSGAGWDHSELGNMLSCVAVCEMIDDAAVKCQDKPFPEDQKTGSPSRSRANAGRSEGGDVPEKYYVVQNNEVIRVKYLLVYAKKTIAHRSQSGGYRSWLLEHKFSLMMIAYVVILCAIGLASSQSFRIYWRRLWR